MADSKTVSRLIVYVTALGFFLLSAILIPSGYQFSNLPKHLVLQILAAVVATALGVISKGNRAQIIPVPILAFAVLSALQLSRSLNPYEASVLLFALTGSIAVGFGVTGILTEESRSLLLRGIVGTTILVSLIGILEFWGVSWAQFRSTGRPSATLGFRNVAAGFVGGCLPLCAFLATRKVDHDRILGCLGAALGLLFVIYTRSRGAWVGVAAALFVFAVWVVANRRVVVGPSARQVLTIAGVLTAILYAGSFSPRFSDQSTSRLDERKQSIQKTVQSFTAPGGDRDRFRIWQHTAEMAVEHSVLGVGLGNWSAYYPLKDRGDVLHIQSAPRRPHNDFLWVFSELSVIGGLLFVWCLFQAGRITFKQADAWRVSGLCCAVCIATHACFSFAREIAPLSMLLWFGLAIASPVVYQKRWLPARVVWAGFAIVSVLGVWVTGQLLVSDAAYARGRIAQEAGKVEAQAEFAAESVMAGPSDHRAFLLLGDALESLGRHEDAVEAYKDYIALQPNLAAVRNNLGRILNVLAQFEEAEVQLEAGRELLPDDRMLINNLAETYRKQGRREEALGLYSGLGQLTISEHENLGLLYAELDSLESALLHYREVLRIDPSRNQIVYSIAGIDLIKGDFEGAIRGYEAYLVSPDSHPVLIRRSKKRLGQAYTSLGLERMQSGDAKGALIYLSKRRALGDASANDLHTLALAYGRDGQFEQAEQAAREALDKDADLVIAYLTIGNALFEQGSQKSDQFYRTFLDRWTGDPRLAKVARSRLGRQKQN